jgi:hypothetical protein
MDADIEPRPSLESKYELLYRLMVIAAVAIILISLAGIASVTGLLPRLGDVSPKIEMRGNDAERPNGAQSESGQSAPAATQGARSVVALRTLPSDVVSHCGAAFNSRTEYKRTCLWH